MNSLKKGYKASLLAVAAVALVTGLSGSFAHAATLTYNANGTGSGYGTSNNGTSSWEGNVWSTTTSSTAASSTWVGGDVAEFLATSATYTVAAGQDESISGLNSATTSTAETTIISQAASTTGDLNLVSGLNNFTIADASSLLKITAPIVGSGGIEQLSNGAIALYGNNSYSGGTEVTGGQVTNYNNNNSFGTGNIIVAGNGEAIVNGGSAGVTIANNWTLNSNYSINLAAGVGTIAAPNTIFSGNFPLPAAAGTTNFETSNATTTVVEISGIISGNNNVEFSDKGTMILAGPNSYTGTTLVSSAVNGPVTLVLGASGTIASSSQVIMSGGILNPDAMSQIMSATTMNLAGTSVTSTIDYGIGASEIDFANSSGVSWTPGDVLDLMNWTPGVDALRFGTDDTGLTAAQLAMIEINGDSTTLGAAALDANGFVVVPEPASLSLIGLGAIGLMARRRK